MATRRNTFEKQRLEAHKKRQALEKRERNRRKKEAKLMSPPLVDDQQAADK